MNPWHLATKASRIVSSARQHLPSTCHYHSIRYLRIYAICVQSGREGAVCGMVTNAVIKKKGRAAKRNLFAELSEGVSALAEARQGKRTLRTHAVEYRPAPVVTPKELMRLRKSLKISRSLFAAYLRTNVRTLENWEQGRAKPNAQAALLIHLVKRYPDTVERLAEI